MTYSKSLPLPSSRTSLLNILSSLAPSIFCPLFFCPQPFLPARSLSPPLPPSFSILYPSFFLLSLHHSPCESIIISSFWTHSVMLQLCSSSGSLHHFSPSSFCTSFNNFLSSFTFIVLRFCQNLFDLAVTLSLHFVSLPLFFSLYKVDQSQGVV